MHGIITYSISLKFLSTNINDTETWMVRWTTLHVHAFAYTMHKTFAGTGEIAFLVADGASALTFRS